MIDEPEYKYLSLRNQSSTVALQQLRYAVISAEYGSFRRAAEASAEFEPPAEFVSDFLAGLIEREAECATCHWQGFCEGYFKWPDPKYSCEGVKQLFLRLEAAAKEIQDDLSTYAA
jgi:hypothetical protein